VADGPREVGVADGYPHDLSAHRPAAWPPPSVRAPTVPTSGAVAERQHLLDVLFLVGLAGVFLANALVGWLEPASFVALVEASRVGAWLPLGPAPWLLPVICVNDFLVGTAVLVSIWLPRAIRRTVLAWAGLWLLAVTLLKLTALDVVRSW